MCRVIYIVNLVDIVILELALVRVIITYFIHLFLIISVFSITVYYAIMFVNFNNYIIVENHQYTTEIPADILKYY